MTESCGDPVHQRLLELLEVRDTELAALKRKVVQYEAILQIAPSSTSSSRDVVPTSPSRQPGHSMDQGGSRGNPMNLFESTQEYLDATAFVGSSSSKIPAQASAQSASRRKLKVEQASNSVIELTDSEPEAVALTNGPASGTKHRKRSKADAGVPESGTGAVVKAESDTALSKTPSWTSRRLKQRKLDHENVAEKSNSKETVRVQVDGEATTSVKHECHKLDEISLTDVWVGGRHTKTEVKTEDASSQFVDNMQVDGGHFTVKKDALSLADMEDTMMQLTDPRAKAKKEFLLKDEEIIELLSRDSALEPYPITLPEDRRLVTVTRGQLSGKFGGSAMNTFPRPSAKRIAEHGYDNFMCIKPSQNPHAPQRPGHGGLFFNITCWPEDPWIANPGRAPVQILFVKLDVSKWLYLGEYEMKSAAQLSAAQWNNLHEAVRNVWVNAVTHKAWGQSIRARIRLRGTLGREPTRHEVESVQDACTTSTERIRVALDSGQESIHVWSMRCVGYDDEFQKGLIRLAEGG